MHPFFQEIEKYPDLKKYCRTDITNLPKPYLGKNKLKGIILGVDPTNEGIKNKLGLIELEYVFGLNHDTYEGLFFAPQKENLDELELSKEDFYIQNLCRNYFTESTYKKDFWYDTFNKIWINYLLDELKDFDSKLPILSTSDVVTFALCPFAKDFRTKEIYKGLLIPNFFYVVNLKRIVYPMYRNKDYKLKYFENYKNFLKEKLNV